MGFIIYINDITYRLAIDAYTKEISFHVKIYHSTHGNIEQYGNKAGPLISNFYTITTIIYVIFIYHPGGLGTNMGYIIIVK